MRMIKVDIKNFIGLPFRSFDLGAMTIIAGPNFSGKTTVADAINYALVGKACRGVTKKKDMPMLVTDGAQKGEVLVTWGEQGAGGEETVVRTVPSMRVAGKAPKSPALSFVLDMNSFPALDDTQRGVELMAIQNKAVDLEDIKRRALVRGCSPMVVDQVAFMALTSFEEAAKESLNYSREAKGAWRTITKQVYGPTKAAGWEQEVPELPVLSAALSTLRADLDKAVETSEAAGEAVIDLFARARAERKRADSISAMQANVANIPALDAALAKGAAKMAEVDKEMVPIQARLDLAKKRSDFYTCPHCQGPIVYDANANAMVTYEGGVEEDNERKMIPSLESSMKSLVAAQRRRMSDINKTKSDKLMATAANKAIGELRKASDPINQIDELLKDQQKAQVDADVEVKRIGAEVTAYDAAHKVMAGAEESTAWAENYHRRVQEWGKAAEEFSSGGIPLEIVSESMAPFNAALAAHASLVNWPSVRIRKDMSIISKDRPYQLLSRSEKWRANAMLSVVIAQQSGLGFVVLDEFDVLEPGDRGPAMTWLFGLRESVQSVVIGTFKSAPASRKGLKVHWLGK